MWKKDEEASVQKAFLKMAEYSMQPSQREKTAGVATWKYFGHYKFH